MKKALLALLIVIVALFSFGTAYAAEVSSTTAREVAVGKQMDGASLDSMFPKVIYVYEGETVTFTNGAVFAPHTVTFLAGTAPLNPQDPKNLAPSAASGVKWDGKALLSSGVLEPGKAFSITFSAAGAYPYYCVLHPLMNGVVVVLPKGASIPSAVEQAAAANAQLDDLKAQAIALEAANQSVDVEKNKDGSLTYKMKAGVGHQGFTVNRMFPETLFINEGDSVEWMNDNHYEPHFVTFNKPADLNFFTDKGDFNPKFMAPSPLKPAPFDGTSFFNSGMIMPQQSYKLTFAKAGSYNYECYLHSGDKMAGTVVVAPKGAVKVLVNGKPLVYDADVMQPHVHQNNVFAAIAPFVKALGGKVAWNNDLSAVVINVGGDNKLPAELQETDGVQVIINGNQLLSSPDLAPQIIDGSSFASLQEMVSALGASYTWDALTLTFSVELQSSAPKADAMPMMH